MHKEPQYENKPLISKLALKEFREVNISMTDLLNSIMVQKRNNETTTIFHSSVGQEMACHFSQLL